MANEIRNAIEPSDGYSILARFMCLRTHLRSPRRLVKGLLHYTRTVGERHFEKEFNVLHVITVFSSIPIPLGYMKGLCDCYFYTV
jgi:hypothetical protein